MVQGTTPCEFELPSGAYLLVISKSGYKTITRNIAYDATAGLAVSEVLTVDSGAQANTNTAGSNATAIVVPLLAVAGVGLLAILMASKKKE